MFNHAITQGYTDDSSSKSGLPMWRSSGKTLRYKA